jgi:hypothetical protein
MSDANRILTISDGRASLTFDPHGDRFNVKACDGRTLEVVNVKLSLPSAAELVKLLADYIVQYGGPAAVKETVRQLAGSDAA